MAVHRTYRRHEGEGREQLQTNPLFGFVVSALAVLLALVAIAPSAWAADSIYWTSSPSIRYGALTGGTVNTLYSGDSSLYGVAIDPAAGKIYWADGAYGVIRVWNLDGSGAPSNLLTGQSQPRGVAIDPAAGKIYWVNQGSSATAGTIRAANLDGSGTQTLFSVGTTYPSGVAIDPAGGKIYWVEAGAIRFGNIDGSGEAATLFSDSSIPLGGSYGVAVDAEHAKIYWTAGGPATGAVRVGNLDGSGSASTMVGSEDYPGGLAIDSAAGKVYYTNGGYREVRYWNLDGTGRFTLFGSQSGLWGVAVLHAPQGTASPAISGGGYVGQQLSCDQGGWGADMVGAFLYRAPRSLAHQWLKDGSEISGATESTYTPSEPGSYTCRVTASNHAGSTAQTSNALTVVDDTTAPTTTDDVDTAWHNAPVTVTLIADDGSGSGVDKTYYTTGSNPADPTTSSAVYDPGDKPVLGNGELIKYYSVDAVGNAETVKSSTAAKVDTAAPTTTDDVDTAWHSAPVTVALTVTHPVGADPVDTYYTTGSNPADPTTSSAVYDPSDKPVLGNGELIKYYSVDAVGNAEGVKSSLAAKVDTAAPATTDSVDTAWHNAPITVTLTVTHPAGADPVQTYYTTGASPADPTPDSAVYDPSDKPVLGNGELIKYYSVDAVGNAEGVKSSLAAKVDTAAPTATAPAQSLPQGAQLATATVPVKFTWKASDNLTAAAQIKSTLRQRTSVNGTTWSGWTKLAGPTTLKAATPSLAPGAIYRQFQVAITDQAGNVGHGPAGPAFRVWPYQESNAAIAYSGTWKQVAQSGAFGGSVRYSTQAGAKATLTATGRNLAVVAPLTSTGGTAKICLDPGTASQKCATVDLSPTAGLGARKIVFARNGLAAGTHKVQVSVLSGRVTLDAFIALR